MLHILFQYLSVQLVSQHLTGMKERGKRFDRQNFVCLHIQKECGGFESFTSCKYSEWENIFSLSYLPATLFYCFFFFFKFKIGCSRTCKDASATNFKTCFQRLQSISTTYLKTLSKFQRKPNLLTFKVPSWKDLSLSLQHNWGAVGERRMREQKHVHTLYDCGM